MHDRQHYRLDRLAARTCAATGGSSRSPRWPDCGRRTARYSTPPTLEVKRWFAEEPGRRGAHRPPGRTVRARHGYLAWLRETVGPDAWIVIEKILAVDEALELSLPVDGTPVMTRCARSAGCSSIPAGRQALTDLVDSTRRRLPRDARAGPPVEGRKPSPTRWPANCAGCAATIVGAVGADHPDLPDAVAALVSHIGVYRSDYLALSSVLPIALAETAAERPELAEPLRSSPPRSPAEHGDRRCGCSSCAARRPRSRWRTACSTATPGWCRSTRSAVNPNWFGVSAAEFHQQRRRAGAVVAAVDGDAVHPRHQTR